MVREIKIVLNSLLTTGQGFKLSLGFVSELQTVESQFTFVGGPVSDIGGEFVSSQISLAQTRINLYNNIVARYAEYSFVTGQQNVDGASILINLDIATSSTLTTNFNPGEVVITHTTTIEPTPPETFTRDKIILSRSPRFVNISPSVPFDQAIMNLKIWRGDFVNDKPAVPVYSLSKLAVQAGQPYIVFDIHNLVNDYVKNSIGIFGAEGSFTTSSFDSVWIEAEITAKYLGIDVGTVNKSFMAVDGFGYHTELANPILQKNVLSSINSHIFYAGSDYPLYFVTDKLVSITINGENVPFTFNNDFNNQVIGYVNAANYAVDENIYQAIFVYEDEVTEAHSFQMKTECRFDVVNCFFKNKFGFWQSIPFSKSSKRNIDVDSEDYSPIVSNFGSYSLQSHNKKQYLFNGKERITVNTDFISENYNALFQELLLSEFVYIQQNDGIFYPVNLIKKTFEKKTKLVNKLIQYSMDFEFSYNLMNTVV